LATTQGRVSLSKKVEGPNISNVFKRTFYQMAYKFQLGGHQDCAGAAFTIPYPVWRSWARHLGDPELLQEADGTYRLRSDIGQNAPIEGNSWIFVFKLSERTMGAGHEAPRTVEPWRAIRTDANTIMDLALNVSPAKALADDGPLELIRAKARSKIKVFWPEIVPGSVTATRRRQPKTSTQDGTQESLL
ncbi:hypothetical protein, partial [Nonomuraea sp. LPB2021202275-12-8]|uniref:hypothetical protein n=1 Tax=Nonomuraea sp. LPB2021202275-12-8 TaxID=3120159 RepID=UPI00300C19BC